MGQGLAQLYEKEQASDDSLGDPLREVSDQKKGQGSDDSLGNPLRGVSVHYLATTFAAEVIAAGLSEDAKIYELEEKVIRRKGQELQCPTDQRKGASYVDAIEGSDGVGIASVMLSYSWGYSMLGDIVPSLLQHCKDNGLDPKETYVWICCLCINQHRVKELEQKGESVPFSKFKAVFEHRVKKIGHVLALMSPWEAPAYLERVWCIFEMFTAIATQSKVTVLMPPLQKRSLCKTLMLSAEKRPMNMLYKSLTQVDVEQAKASKEDDRTRILEILRGPGGPGIKKLNLVVQSFLKQWLMHTMEHEFDSLVQEQTCAPEEMAELCSNIGHMLFDNGHYGRAMETLKTGMKYLAPNGTPDMQTWLPSAQILSEMACLEMKQGRFEASTKAFEEAKSMYVQCGAFQSEAGARLCNWYGALLRKTHNLEGAMDLFLQGLEICRHLNQSESASSASLVGNIGYVKELQNELQAASEWYERAKKIRTQADCLKTPGGALLLTSMAKLNERQGELLAARKLYEEAREIREQTNTLHTPSGALLLTWNGSLAASLHDLEGSWAAYQLAEQIRIDTDTLDTPDGKKLLETIACAQQPVQYRHGGA